jgi:hypothetical protein
MIEKKARIARFAVIILLTLPVVIGTAALAMRFLVNPRLSFERMTIRPIPKSVRNIRADRYDKYTFWARIHGVRAYVFVLCFDIAKEDLSQIVAAHGFRPCIAPTYADGEIFCEVVHGYFAPMSLYYGKDARKPHWFDLGEWTDIEAYIIGTQMTLHPHDPMEVTYLLYNERLGSAYLLKCHKS